jgi:glycosyltransferase involved in cell wall biosynthesis
MAGKSTPDNDEDARAAMPAARAGAIVLWHWGRRGGGPRFTLELARGLRENGERLCFALAADNALMPGFAALGAPRAIERTYRSAGGAAVSLLRLAGMRARLARAIEGAQARAVVSTMPHLFNRFMLGPVKRSGARFITTIHDAAPHPGDRIHVPMRFVRAEAAAADAIVTLSAHVREQVAQWPQAKGKPIALVPHGVFGDAAPAARRRDAHAPLRLLFLGRLLPYKGLNLLTAAYRRLLAEGVDARLRVLGAGNAALLGATGDLPHFTLENRWASDEEMQAAARAADIVVLPYTEASQSGVVPMAMGAATPVVATRIGGLAEQVIDGETGLLCSPDADAIARALARLAQDGTLYERLSRGAAAHAATALSWRAIAAVYQRLADGDGV